MEDKNTMDTTSQREIKLLIDNSLLEQEKRLSKEFRSELEVQTARLTSVVEKQNLMYSNQIVELNKDVATLNTVIDNLRNNIKGIKTQMTVVGTACATLGGLVGFFIAQMIR